MRNAGIKRYFSQHHPEILTEFNAIISATSLDQTNSDLDPNVDLSGVFVRVGVAFRWFPD